MGPCDLRLFEIDDESLGADMFSGKLVLLLGLDENSWDPENPCWGALIEGKRFRLGEGMLERFTSPVQGPTGCGMM
jgi:hypothetical protein